MVINCWPGSASPQHTPSNSDARAPVDTQNATIARSRFEPSAANNYFAQHEVREVNERHGIVTQAWSPIGGVYGWTGNQDVVPPLANEVIVGIAQGALRRLPRRWCCGGMFSKGARSCRSR